MPTNLNALIRYKQIDRCLRNTYKAWTIEMLIESCSEAVAEFRGRYEKIAERTIREDIHVMRSDMLGFNAPIVVEGGYYSYSDPSYSIFNVTISEKELLKEVLMILLEVRDKLNGNNPLKVLEQLANLTGIELPNDIREKINEQNEPQVQFMMARYKEKEKQEFGFTRDEPKAKIQFDYAAPPKKMKFSWKRILELV